MLYALCAALSLALLGLDQRVRPSPFCPGW